jgi:hypothetical protein
MLDDARKAQLEEARQRTIAAQQAMHEELERIAADEIRRQQLQQQEEARLMALTSEQVARENEARILAQQQLDRQAKNEATLNANMDAKLAEVSAPSDMASQKDADEELKRWQLAGLAAEKAAPKCVTDASVNTDAELAAIRERINSILNSDLSASDVA